MTVVEFQPSLAQGLAELWNRSDAGWPMGFVRGHDKTAEDVLEDVAEYRTLATLLALDGERVVGFLRVLPFWEDPRAAYVATVNVDPNYHGKGHGKALMLRAMEVATAAGYRRVDLYTWPGNTRAMPLYKRLGFRWVPGTSVHMQTFVPEILAQPMLKPFFDRVPWYPTLQGNPTQGEDGTEVEGLKVYPYEWSRGDDVLRVWVDRAAGTVVGFEDRERRMVLRPREARLRLGMANALEVRLGARGPALRGSVGPARLGRETFGEATAFDLEAGSTGVISHAFTLPRTMAEAPEGAPSPRVVVPIESPMGSLELGFGVDAQKPLPVEVVEEDPALYHGRPRTLHLSVSNNLGREVRARVRVRGRGSVGADVDQAVVLAPDGHVVVPVPVDARPSKAPVGALAVQVRVEGVPRADDTIPIPTLVGNSAVVYGLPGDAWILESSTTRCRVRAHGGDVDIIAKRGNRTLVRHMVEALGPPFVPVSLAQHRWQVTPGRGSLVLRATPPDLPGVVLTKALALEGNLLTLRYGVEGPPGALEHLQLLVGGRRGWDFGTLMLPMEGTIVEDDIVEFEYPDLRDIAPRGMVDEGWAHVREGDRGVGFVWDSPRPWEVDVEFWNPPVPRFELGNLPPGQGPMVMVLAPEVDWREVRRRWATVAKGEPALDPRAVEGVVALHPSPAVPFLRPGGKLAVEVTNRRRKPMDGALTLHLPPGVTGEDPLRGLNDLDHRKPFTTEWILRAQPTRDLQVLMARLTLVARGRVVEEELPLVALAPPSSLAITQDGDVWVLAHDPFTLHIAPAFAGTATSLVAQGQELLHSSHPTAREFSWFYPWHGGLVPQLHDGDTIRDLEDVKFEASILRDGAWEGLRLVGAKAKEDLDLSIDYLVLPGAPLLATRLAVRNTGTKLVEGRFGQALFLRPGGLTQARLHYLHGEWRRREPSDARAFLRAGRAVVLEPPRGGPSLAVTSPTPSADTWVGDFGDLGRYPVVVRDYALQAGQSQELVTYLALAPNAEVGKALAALGRRPLKGDGEPREGSSVQKS